MSKIIKYVDYVTKNPMMIPINEGRGIPNILKEIIDGIYDKVMDKIKNPSNLISLDFEYEKFNIRNLYISITNREISEIYATSTFGTYSNSYLKSPSINIYMDYDNYNKLDLKRIILHELLHIYEIFNRIEKGTKKDLQWGLNKILLDIRSKYSDDKFISDLIYMIYLSLDQEINARVAETYIILMEFNTNDKEQLIEELKKTSAWKYKNYLKEFDTVKYNISENKLNDFFKELSDEVLLKYDMNFNLYKKGNIKNWIRLFKKKSTYFENKLFALIGEVINDIDMVNTSYVDIDRTKKLSEKFITKYNSILEKKSLDFKKKREY